MTAAAGGAQRRVFVVGAVDSIGLGLYLASIALFLQRVVGLDLGEVGLVLSLAGLASVFGLMPIARFAQRIGLRRGLTVLFVARALSYAALAFASSLPAAAVAAALAGLFSRGTAPIVESMLIDGATTSEAVPLLAKLRMIRNAGIALGAVPVGIALSIGDPQLLRAALLGSSLLLLMSALTVSTVPAQPHAAAVTAPALPSLNVLRDFPFFAVTAVHGVLSLSAVLLLVGLPLWVVNNSVAPGWTVSSIQIVNTLLVVALQVPFARGTDILVNAHRWLWRGGVLAVSATALVAVGSTQSPVLDLLLVLVVVVLFTFSELLFVAGGEGAALHHIPEGQRPTYLAAFNVGFAVATIIGPPLVTLTVAGPDVLWLAWSALFLATALAARRLPAPTQAPAGKAA